jgi:rifampicin phosphotransferase
LEVTRGLPHNVTTEMDLALWDTAQAIRSDPAAAAYFQSQPAATLAADFQAARMPPAAQSAVQKFMDRYGMRGVGEIDLGRKRWREDPTSVMQSLNSYLQITQPEAAPAAVFARGAVVAQQAADQIAAQLRRTKGGWWKAPIARFLASRTRELTGLRESPKLTIIRIFGEIRLALL